MSVMNYLRKMKMYALLCSVVDENILDSARDCTYEFYRGSEMLRCCSVSGKVLYELYSCPVYVSLNVLGYDDYTASYSKDLNRITYRLEKGKLVETYRRETAI